MKRMFITMALVMVSIGAMASMSSSKMRDYARFLSDRMAYELDFSARQYDDCFEINYDFLYAVNHLLDDMAYGYEDAIAEYYRQLDYRNDDLRYIMTSHQYVRFMEADYFYRPIYTHRREWRMRIYSIYDNPKFYYYDAPLIYKSYRGEHSRVYHSKGFYVDRHRDFEHYHMDAHIHGSKGYDVHRRNDFGAKHQEAWWQQI